MCLTVPRCLLCDRSLEFARLFEIKAEVFLSERLRTQVLPCKA